ncbi:MAG: M23 family metallopeptidase [bacterium]
MKNFLYISLIGFILFLPLLIKSGNKERFLGIEKKELLASLMIESHNVPIPKLEEKQSKNRVVYTTYITKTGDTLWSISRKFGLNLSTLISVNNLTTNVIKEGISLKIPSQKGIVHKVKSGQTLWDIARTFNVSLNKIREVNGISTSLIRPGEKIFLPGANLTQEIALAQNLSDNFVKPILGRITSGFGYRFHPILRRYCFHPGIDVAAPYGSSIKSAAPGKVIFAGWKSGYGRCVIIKHNNTYKTLYAHLSRIFVHQGQLVEKKESIGAAGDSGFTTGTHLHFEVLKNNRPIDPRTLIY